MICELARQLGSSQRVVPPSTYPFNYQSRMVSLRLASAAFSWVDLFAPDFAPSLQQ